MKRVRQRVPRELTGSNRGGVKDIPVIIRELNRVLLRGWGNYFATGNASKKFIQIDRYVQERLVRLLCRRHGRNLKPGQVKMWTSEWFGEKGLHRLRGTTSYPGAA